MVRNGSKRLNRRLGFDSLFDCQKNWVLWGCAKSADESKEYVHLAGVFFTAMCFLSIVISDSWRMPVELHSKRGLAALENIELAVGNRTINCGDVAWDWNRQNFGGCGNIGK